MANHSTEEKFNGNRYRGLFEKMSQGIALYRLVSTPEGLDFTLLEINPAFERMTGLRRSALKGKTLREISPDSPLIEPFTRIALGGDPEHLVIFSQLAKRWLEVHAFQPGPSQCAALITDVSERIASQEATRENEKRLHLFIENAPAALAMFDREMKYLAASRRWLSDYGLQGQNVIGRSHYEIFPEISEVWRAVHQRGLNGEVIKQAEDRFERRDGTALWLQWEVQPWYRFDRSIGGIVIFSQDLTEHKRMEQERLALKEQLAQAQKMESVGRLAGGVAHDYNNMLSLIIGYAELVLEQVAPDHPIHGDVDEILKAARRSLDITKQLLAFARQQTIAPKILDINQAVSQALKMLKRLIGEDIDLTWLPGENLLPVSMDPGQLEQVLANLCINARDAIQDVGHIVIQTGPAEFAARFSDVPPGISPGVYTALSVRDNGCGIDPEVLDKIFEPFFTTKELGMGTGLGLSTVYGIIQQNSGFVRVESEPGKGTDIHIYLPGIPKTPDARETSEAPALPLGDRETILVVEDEDAILRLAEKVLSSLNYRVLLAKGPEQAMEQAAASQNRIALLITDVIMPQMNGRELADRLKRDFPGLRCLFMSGYPANVIARHGVLDKGVHFLQKPFSKKDLADSVREAMTR